MRSGIVAFVIGIGLLVMSFPLIFSAIRETFINKNLHEEYEITPVFFSDIHYFIEDNGDIGIETIGNASILVGNQFRVPSEIHLADASLEKIDDMGFFEQTFLYHDQMITIRDQFPLGEYSDPLHYFPVSATSPIEVIINGRSFEDSKPIQFRPSEFGGDRYNNGLGLLLVQNKSTSQESLAIIKHFGEDESWSVKNSHWKILLVSKEGQTKVETFDNRERKAAPYRTAFINEANVAPTWLGYTTDEVAFYTTFMYPLIYPWFTAFLGLLFTVIGGIQRIFFTQSTAV
ncbi:hypothetical protein [Bacillus sp. EB01]|uniref:hypothetical protein n=1 Tax=Bacillus sp. EB01 TaxID=1347086 RepID=UPI0005C5D87E|nr:hypothetical protein [Bacillus sp. EB01]